MFLNRGCTVQRTVNGGSSLTRYGSASRAGPRPITRACRTLFLQQQRAPFPLHLGVRRGVWARGREDCCAPHAKLLQHYTSHAQHVASCCLLQERRVITPPAGGRRVCPRGWGPQCVGCGDDEMCVWVGGGCKPIGVHKPPGA
eukprot:7391966-Prymnesium_polylepis.1